MFEPVYLLLLLWWCSVDAAVWSVEAKERCLNNSINTESATKECSVIFYGTYQERLLYKRCEKLKCDFISNGCIHVDGDPPPTMICYSILNKMTHSDANCPYKPCEEYNSKSQCVPNNTVCIQNQGQVLTFGLCKLQKQCCLFLKSTGT